MNIPKPVAFCVESEEEHKESLRLSLAQKGFDARFFNDGAKLLNYLIENSAKVRPSFILLDVSANGIGGFEAARRLTLEPGGQSIPIVMMAKHCCPEDKIEAQSAGALTCLQKPVSLENVEAEIEAKKQRLAKNQLVVDSQFKMKYE